jgi:hypothetical protein
MRRIPAAASLKISIRLWASSVPNIATPVTFPPERARPLASYGIGNRRQDNGNRCSLTFQCERRCRTSKDDGSGVETLENDFLEGALTKAGLLSAKR